ncbi:hypothetical protein FXO38_12803 [Capsicum annuum]|nr:hypothetical protein FXO38_12803 [Capsicum annuum]
MDPLSSTCLIKKLNQSWEGYDVDLLSYIDITTVFIEKLDFKVVKQLLVTGPNGKYFLLKDDLSIRTLQSVLSSQFRVLQLFAVDEGEASVIAPNIFLFNQPSLNEEDIGIGTDAESEEEDKNEPVPSDYDSEELEFFRKEKHREVNDQLDIFLELEKSMCFKNLIEAKRVVSYYSIANKKGLQVDKSDTTRLRYVCDVGCLFECLISEDKKSQEFKIKTLNTNHTYLSAFKNRRATQDVLAQYFKKKIQNDPKYKVTDMRKYLNDMFKLNVSYSTMKRVKRLILDKLEGSYIDEFNKLEAYAQELGESNPDTESFNKWILNARGKPIIKMLEEIRIKAIVRLKELEEKGINWEKKFSPYVKELYTDYNMIAHCCEVKSNGDQWYEVVKGEDMHVVHLGRKKCTCRTWDLTVDPAHDMKPPEIQKTVGRSKVTRKKEKVESRKREGVWSASRKGPKMAYGHYGATGHNQRKCPLLNRSKEPVQDVLVLAPRDSQESGVFMPTLSCVASLNQQTNHSNQYACLSTGSSNPKTNAKKFVGASRSKNKLVGPELHVVPSSAAVADTNGDKSEEDE